jgi:hypothetical protein
MGARGTAAPPAQRRPRGGRPRKVHRRAVLPTLCSRPRRGCPGDRVPHALRPKRTGSDEVVPWRDDGPWAKMGKGGREQRRGAAGRVPTPRVGCSARPSVQTPELGGPERGADGGKQSHGRQRPLWGATLG